MLLINIKKDKINKYFYNLFRVNYFFLYYYYLYLKANSNYSQCIIIYYCNYVVFYEILKI